MTHSRHGFTLIELSIVLIIIGLITGGILVGRDLIRASERRAQIAQVEKYEAAVKAFRLKYNMLPGDIPDPVPLGLGFMNNPAGGDDILTGGSTLVLDNPESQNFWYQLAASGMIEGTYSQYGMPDDIPGIDSPALKLQGVGVRFGMFPNMVNPLGGMWVVYRDRYFTIVMPQATHAWFLTSTLQLNTWYGIYTAQDMYALDSKMDDGNPTKGNFQAMSGSYVTGLYYNYSAPGTPDACIINNGGGNFAYNLGPIASNPTQTSLCAPLIRALF